MSDEAQEVARVAEGDRAAFSRLVELHGRRIEAYSLRILGDRARSQDVAQEVMLKLWLNAGRFDPQRARLTTWLHQIAHNLCIDSLRAGKRLQAMDDDSLALLEDPESQRGQDVDEELTRALAALPDRQREALVLTYYQELSNKEVAEVMALGVRAVESLLVRARTSLRKHLESEQ